MLTARAIFAALVAGTPVPGRHIVVTAHPDDETISFGGALPLLADVALVQLTDGVSRTTDREAQIAGRRRERDAAVQVLGLHPHRVHDAAVGGRQAYQQLLPLLAIVRAAIADADVVWTHPYEGGHVDHDAAAWLVQTAVARSPRTVLRLEFASYHSHAGKKSTFGAFWPDPTVRAITVTLTGDRLARKLAAIAAYASQAHILRKFPTVAREPYRVAPGYDFTRPAPPPQSRWDSRGYRPTTADVRLACAAAARDMGPA